MEKTIVEKPLKPTQGRTLHVKRSYSEALSIWHLVVVEELVDFENPTNKVCAIKTRYAQFQVTHWKRLARKET